MSDSYKIISFPGPELPKNYEGLVFAQWLHTLRFGNAMFKNMDADAGEAFYNEWHKLIERVLASPNCIVRIAALTDDNDVALGFSVCRDDIIDYVCVHKDHRKMGIGTKLMPPVGSVITHLTSTAMHIWQSNDKYKHLKFNPFA